MQKTKTKTLVGKIKV